MKHGIFNGMYGKQHSTKTKIKQSLEKRGLYDGQNNPMYGKQHTIKAKHAISESRKKSVWIYNPLLAETKLVQIDSVHLYTQNGWIKGRGPFKRGPGKNKT